MDPELMAEAYDKYVDDFPTFAADWLKIRPKAGGLVPFVMNDSQHYVYDKMMDHKEETGRIRVLCLKGRQSGISTMAEGMCVHTTLFDVGIQSGVVAHQGASATSIFNMTKRYVDHLPMELCPPVKRSNAREVAFDGLDSSVKVYSASGNEIGRGETFNGLLHLSEAAFYENASEMLAGLLQSIPDSASIIVESTANGMAGWFYSAWKQAEAAERGDLDENLQQIVSPWRTVFLPYFWVKEYRSKPPANFVRSPEEQALIDMYGSQGMDDHVLQWRRLKIAEFTDGVRNPYKVFDQEYPHSPAVAFSSTAADGIIKSELVLKAQKTELQTNGEQPVIGVDVSSGDGVDKTLITWRTGSKFVQEEFRANSAALIDHLYEIFERDNPAAMLIDGGAMGITVVQSLHQKYNGVNSRIHAIYFGGSAEDKTLYLNARAEMVGRMNRLLSSGLPVDLPDDEELRAELTQYRGRKNAEKQLVLESKDEMRKELGRSPDKGDSALLTLSRQEYF